MVKIPPLKAPTTDIDARIAAALKPPIPTVVSESGEVSVVPGKEPEDKEMGRSEAAPEPAAPAAPTLPWDGANERIVSFFQVRMPEPLKLKIEWLDSRNIGKKRRGQHQIVLDALEREIDRLVAKELKGAKGE